MKYLLFLIIILIQLPANSQNTDTLIAHIQSAQKKLHDISYSLQRSDTFVTGATRITKGKAIMKMIPTDSVHGFAFRAQREDINSYIIYDGYTGYSVNNETKRYEVFSKRSLPLLLGVPGGQMIFSDLARLDTTGAIRVEMREDKAFQYLTFHYPDIKEYDVEHRYKTFTIDKDLFLPVSVRIYQETLGKKQHLHYQVKDLKINNEALKYDFSNNTFLESYSQEIPPVNKSLNNLIGKPAPAFELKDFNGRSISSSSFKGKVILLDFWEVWCGPCIASMPKVQALGNRYKNKGLQVYGIISEAAQLDVAKRLVDKRGINFTMLIGNAEVQESYKLNAVPLYILINKKGIISFISEGYADNMEEEIQKSIAE